MLHRLHTSQHLPRPREVVFPFFADAANLEHITPPELRFHIVTPPPILMQAGTRITYRLRLFGVPFAWHTVITRWEPPSLFVDEQIKGPYRLWVHTHRFHDHGDGTRMEDEVIYRLPCFPLGELAYPLVRRELRWIFSYRRQVIAELLGG